MKHHGFSWTDANHVLASMTMHLDYDIELGELGIMLICVHGCLLNTALSLLRRSAHAYSCLCCVD